MDLSGNSPLNPPPNAPEAQEAGAPVLRRRDAAAGIYIHVPFCARLCPYCDFAVDVRRTIPHEAYADALIAEFERRKHDLVGRHVQTIYLGGGTPSLWAPDQLARVVAHVQASLAASDTGPRSDATPGAGSPENALEICMEANPMDVSPQSLRAWVAAGINRLSIGCQSFQPRVLKALNRNHSRLQALQALDNALTFGPAQVSLDLLFGNPGQTMQEWEQDLDEVEKLTGLAHLSAYNLTIEPGTAFFRRRERGRLTVPDDERCFAMLDYLIARGEAMGFGRYEVSSFARPGCRSRHNTLYWTGAEYLGLGVGAHSLRIDRRHSSGARENQSADNAPAGVFRRANPRRTDEYMAAPGLAYAPQDTQALSAHEHLVERLFLGVRTRVGLDVDELRHQFVHAVPPATLARAEALLAQMCAQEFLVRDGPLFIPTHLGLNVADGLAEQFAQNL